MNSENLWSILCTLQYAAWYIPKNREDYTPALVDTKKFLLAHSDSVCDRDEFIRNLNNITVE